MTTTLVRSGTLVCMDAAGTIARGDLLVRDGAIAAIGGAVPASPATMPGGARGGRGPRRLPRPPREALEQGLALARRFHGAAGGRLRVSLAPRFVLSCSEGLWRDVSGASLEHGLLVHTHLAESPAEGRE